jgi:hypothetical protein
MRNVVLAVLALTWEAPAGQETNWVPTDTQRGFELMSRVYGPTEEFFEKAWMLPDVEKIAAQ